MYLKLNLQFCIAEVTWCVECVQTCTTCSAEHYGGQTTSMED